MQFMQAGIGDPYSKGRCWHVRDNQKVPRKEWTNCAGIRVIEGKRETNEGVVGIGMGGR